MFIEINPRTSAISVKVISFFEISFVTRKIVSGTTRRSGVFDPLLKSLFRIIYYSFPRASNLQIAD